MEALTIPPSPSWYLSDILCIGLNGEVIYGTRYDLIILQFDFNSPGNVSSPKFQTVSYAHKERIAAVRFCPVVESAFSNCFVSAGDDSLVKLWDLKTLTPINVNFAHGDGKKVVSVDWSPVAPNEIVSVDDSGVIVVWDIVKNITNKLNISNLLKMKKSFGVKVSAGKFSPSTIKCCPHEKDLLAVGMKGGIVCLMSTKDSGRVFHCLRGHDKDVSSLAWCPELGNVFDDKDNEQKTLIFASVCIDRVIYFWNALNGRFVKIIKLPTTYFGRNARLPSSSPPLLCWPDRCTILSTSNFGEVLKCNLLTQKISEGNTAEVNVENDNSSAKKMKSIWTVVHDIHPRGVFTINVAKYSIDGRDDKITVLWSTAQDRNMIAFSLEDDKVLVNLPTVGGFVYSIAPSPLDPSRVAVGLGDFSIRIWNTGNSKSIQMNSLWHKIKGKVMSVAWHPTQEMKLAYGTHEGRVGIQDLIPGHMPTVFILRHRDPVYALSWGPPCFKEGEVHNYPKFCLYSCGDGIILMYNPDEPEKEPEKMNVLMKRPCREKGSKKKEVGCTDIAWKPDYSIFAVGNSDGTLQLYSAPHLTLVYTIYAHQKLLMCLAWHPMSTSTDVGFSPLQHCLATGSNDKTIHVFDLSNLMKSIAAQEEFKGTIQPIASCKGHHDKVVRIAWSPHSSGQLCSASYDSTVRVWDTIHQKCYGCFIGEKGAFLSCVWSSLDPDIIICGSSNFTLISWRISEAKFNPKSSNRPKKVTASPFSPIENTEKRTHTTVVGEAESSKSSSHIGKIPLFPVSFKTGGGIGNVNGIHQLLEKEETGHFSDINDPMTAKLGFFGSKEDMGKLLEKEVDHHLNNGSIENARLIELWKGNVAEMVKDAIAKGNLSEWLLSIAPSASHKLWLEACQAYSEQLAKDKKYDRAASYLLACHKVDEAVELLRGQSLYREALAIARCRLDEEDPTIHKLLLEWGQDLVLKGNYELAGMCFTSIKEYIDAARTLYNRANKPECISLAAQLALKAGEEGKELAMNITSQCLLSYLSENNWDGAFHCIKPIDELKPFSIVIELQRKLVEGCKSFERVNRDLLSLWLSKEGKETLDSDIVSPLLQVSMSTWINDSSINPTEAYTFISNRRSTSVQNFMTGLAEELSLAVCAASSGDRVKEVYHILKSMNVCYSRQLLINKEEDLQFSLLHLLVLLYPEGPGDLHTSDEKVASETVKGHMQSIRAYSALAAAMWSESKWLECDGEWPWHLLASFLISYLPDALDTNSAIYYKEEVKIHKIEQELAKLKANLRISGIQIKNSSEKSGDNSSRQKHNINVDITKSQHVLESVKDDKEEEESDENRSEEEVIKDKESTLVDLKSKKEEFERTRASAPNPFLLLFKFRNIADFMVKSCGDKEGGLDEVFQEFLDKVSKVNLNSLE